MNINDDIEFEGILTADSTADEKLRELVRRVELLRKSLVNQLRREPTVFYADPDVDIEAVSGAKAGDVAVWRDGAGVDQFRILGL